MPQKIFFAANIKLLGLRKKITQQTLADKMAVYNNPEFIAGLPKFVKPNLSKGRET
jgi:hypothetical protein